MKTVNYIMVAVVVTLGFSGCYDLDVAPYDKVAQNNYWKTEADAKSGVMGVYAQLKDYGAYGYMPLFDTYSDIGHGPGGPVEQGTGEPGGCHCVGDVEPEVCTGLQAFG